MTGKNRHHIIYSMVIEIPGIDTKKGLDLFEGDTDTYTEILRSYVTNIPGSLEKMRNVSEATLKDYAVKVHGVKSVSDSIGAEEARRTAKHLEELAKAGDLAGVQAENDALIQYVENLIDAINAWLKKNDL